MRLGIFITTHISKGYRHGKVMESTMFENFKNTTIKSHIDFNPGMDSNIYICDTGSTDEQYLNWKIPANITKIDIPNTGGCWAAMKYLMHKDIALANEFDYILFQVDDDGCYPRKDNWALDLIDKYEKDKRVGIMGRFLDSIKLGPNGLVDHRNCCPHMAKMWGITENKIVSHLHAYWIFMRRDILKQLADIWYNPIYSVEAMDYQKKWENEDFCKLANLGDNRVTLDNIHIGREVDLSLRIERLGYRCSSYKGTAVFPNAIEPHKHWKDPNIPVKGFYGEYKYETN